VIVLCMCYATCVMPFLVMLRSSVTNKSLLGMLMWLFEEGMMDFCFNW